MDDNLININSIDKYYLLVNEKYDLEKLKVVDTYSFPYKLEL
ncbi:hypothetical protein EAKF1_ch3160 [Escherichia albertii KF1]|nr:hypothetical protein EAKF1_ch3160 [Escherichia albertii KF1]